MIRPRPGLAPLCELWYTCPNRTAKPFCNPPSGYELDGARPECYSPKPSEGGRIPSR